MENFNFTSLMWGGAAIGFVTSCWQYIKAILWKICNLCIQRIEIQDEVTASAVTGYIIKNFGRSRLYDKSYGSQYDYIRDGKEGRYGNVSYEQFGKRSLIMWSKRKLKIFSFPFLFHGPEKSSPASTTNSSQGANYYSQGNDTNKQVFASIVFIRGTLNCDKIVREAVAERNDLVWNVQKSTVEKQKRFFIKHVPDISDKGDSVQQANQDAWWFRNCQFRLLEYETDQIGRGKTTKVSSLDALIFPERVKTLIEEIKLWRNNKEWYQKRGIPWKRGWMLYGPPGTGKTGLARAFAEDLDLPIYVFDLSDITNHELMRAWIAMQQSAPCIALIEDIDNVFHGRDNVSRRGGGLWSMMRPNRKDKDGKAPDGGTKGADDEGCGGGMLNFDVLLNCLDGVEKADGVFTIITTNDIEKVDEALGRPRKLPDGSVEFISSRPGRIDKAIELTYMEIGDKRLMAHKILDEYPECLKEILEFVDKFPDLLETPAQFQERCSQIALAKFWQEAKAAEAKALQDKVEKLPEESPKETKKIYIVPSNGKHVGVAS